MTSFGRKVKVKSHQKFSLTGLKDKFAQRSHGVDGSSLKNDFHHHVITFVKFANFWQTHLVHALRSLIPPYPPTNSSFFPSSGSSPPPGGASKVSNICKFESYTSYEIHFKQIVNYSSSSFITETQLSAILPLLFGNTSILGIVAHK